MAARFQSAHPVQSLRETIASLDSAILLCHADPREKAVHLLRTTTRRMEAHLQLLALLPGQPLHRKRASKLLRLLKKLRRAAGAVRDLDVQSGLLHEAEQKKLFLQDARTLRRTLKRRRQLHAIHLVDVLYRQQDALAVALKSLLDSLIPIESLALDQRELVTLVLDWYNEMPASNLNSADQAQFHNIRKRAKIARYLAEAAPKSARSARRLATRFEKLQQAGGVWHDWLTLANISEVEFGNSSALTLYLAARTCAALRNFRRLLGQNLAKLASIKQLESAKYNQQLLPQTAPAQLFNTPSPLTIQR